MPGPQVIDELVTVRDWLRYAVSRFSAAGLSYGHGTGRSKKEAEQQAAETAYRAIAARLTDGGSPLSSDTAGASDSSTEPASDPSTEPPSDPSTDPSTDPENG